MVKKLLVFAFILSGFQSFAQPDPVYSQYMFNQFVINPGYAGVRNSMAAVLVHRTRWTGISEAPSTSSFSIQTPLNKKSFAFGFNTAADRLGPVTNILAGVSTAYHVRLNKAKLSFGLRAGLYGRGINGSKLDFKDVADPLYTGARQTSTRPSVDFGMFYYTRKFYVGFAVNHIGTNEFSFSAFPDATFNLRQYATLGIGYAFELDENVVIKPSMLIKNSDGFDTNVDVNIAALFYKKFWFAISLRSQTNLNFLLDLNVMENLRVGYSYDVFLNSLNKASSGTHEFFVGFDLVKDEVKTISPRYL